MSHASLASSRARTVTLVLAAVLLSASYVFNVFGLQPFRYSGGNAEYGHNGYANYWGVRGFVPAVRTETFQIDSEMLVLRKIEASERGGGLWKDAGLLVRDAGDGEQPYVSQFGLEGQLLTLAHRFSSQPVHAWIDSVVRPVLALLTVGVVLLLLAIFSRNLSPGLVALLALLLACSDWIVFVAPSVVYITFLYLLPLALGWMLPRSRPESAVPLLVLIFVVCLLAALCGYGYMSNIALGATIGTVYFGFLEGTAPWTLARKMFVITAWGIAGLGVAILLHVGQLTLFSGSVPGALHLLAERASERAAVPTVMLFLRTTVAYATVSLVQVPLGFFVLHLPLWFWLLVQIALLVAAVRERRAPALTPASAAAVSALWALLCSLTWAVLFPQHLAVHVHLDPIIFYLPWMPVLFYATVLRMQAWR